MLWTIKKSKLVASKLEQLCSLHKATKSLQINIQIEVWKIELQMVVFISVLLEGFSGSRDVAVRPELDLSSLCPWALGFIPWPWKSKRQADENVLCMYSVCTIVLFLMIMLFINSILLKIKHKENILPDAKNMCKKCQLLHLLQIHYIINRKQIYLRFHGISFSVDFINASYSTHNFSIFSETS